MKDNKDKHQELSKKMDTKFKTIDSQLEQQELTDSSTLAEVDALKMELASQKYKVAVLEEQMTKLLSLSDLVKEMDSKIEDTNDRLTMAVEEQNEAIEETMLLVNSVEAHGRRWAVRIIGLPSPRERNETTHQAKEVDLQFFKDKLKISDLLYNDIDCAHRVGSITDFKQTMLIRFHARDSVDYVMRYKTNLKGSGIVLYEDTTWRNRKLINKIKRRADVDSAWCIGGTIWCKLHKSPNKIKITLGDDLDVLLGPLPDEASEGEGSPVTSANQSPAAMTAASPATTAAQSPLITTELSPTTITETAE
jgi:hypothetical protein